MGDSAHRTRLCTTPLVCSASQLTTRVGQLASGTSAVVSVQPLCLTTDRCLHLPFDTSADPGGRHGGGGAWSDHRRGSHAV